ncbi:MAG TPA: phosphopantetheine-binding protein [Micromonosporaceae bacterium]|nr:phosphopantetheine-binding protein [Micromonosporaceae bacterium]
MTTRADVVGAVREAIGEILPGLPPGEVIGDRHLRDLGADSVDRVEIILGAQDRLGLAEPLSAFADLRDIDALVDLLWERAS